MTAPAGGAAAGQAGTGQAAGAGGTPQDPGEEPIGHPSGLPLAVVRIYRLRVAHPTDSTEQLAARAGCHPGEAAKAEHELASLGLLRPSPDGGWVAVSPENAAEAVLAEAEQEILRLQVAMAATRARLHALSGHYLEARSLRSAKTDIEVVEGLEAVREVIADLAGTTTRTLDAFVPGSTASIQAISAALPVDLPFLARRGRMRTLFQHALRRHAPFVQYVTRLARAGARVRSVGVLPSRMLIADGECAVLPLDPAKTGAGAIIIRDPVVLAFLQRLFEHFWGQSQEFLTGGNETGPAPTGTEREVLRLIAAGRTNESIAHQLGISPRTVTRLVAEVMERLGAASRFQAGVKAAQQGWLD
ncbi:LuxR C-terminal-related transcriptional regulator [Streptomyces sp. YIM 98790]|uniref:helix-turn-helix transcriptional regulator n=1 Tax=Streptomyces sp. YIM 98790 TaxID=2689077 RepID=UPI0028BE7349|nr:LuxR C-terminal-related transcriptional regulator [Streptomyces sp. YIM 98790]